jgi:hypothetical protein
MTGLVQELQDLDESLEAAVEDLGSALTGEVVAGGVRMLDSDEVDALIGRVIARVELARGELAGLILLADCGEWVSQ